MKKNIIFYYLSKMQIISFLFTFFAMCLFVFLIDLTDTIKTLSMKGLYITFDVIKLSIYKSLIIVQSVISYLFLLSNTIIFRKLNQTDQMTILKNLGHSIYDIVLPSVIVGAVIGILNVFCFHCVVTCFSEKIRCIEEKIFAKPAKQLKTSEIWVQQKSNGQDILIYIDKIEENVLKSVIMYNFNDPNVKQILADTATIRNDNTWLLNNVSIVTTDKKILHLKSKLVDSNLQYKHLMLYYKDPKNTDIFTLLYIISLRKEAGLSVIQYWFHINVLLVQLLIPIIMAILAIIFCYKHHRYAFKNLSLLLAVTSGLILHFISQLIRSSGGNNLSYELFICWTFWILMFLLALCLARSVERSL